MIAEIRALNPKPGLAFGSEPVQPVVPDVFVATGRTAAGMIELNSDTLPRLLVNARYYGTVSKGARDKDSKNYLTDCLNNANWLVKSLDQRARTILKVASEIVRQQDAFPHPWRAPSAAAQPAHHRRRDRDARIHGQPRHLQQIHRHAARRCSS